MSTKNIWFTSDLHFYHNNCVIFGKRPCTFETHNEFIIDSLSQSIKPGDIVYHLGDLSFGKVEQDAELIRFLNKLNVSWNFILGNHDKVHRLEAIASKLNGKFLGAYHQTSLDSHPIMLCHYPIEDWNKKHRGSLHLHGHIHAEHSVIQDIPNRFNVCFDVKHKPFHFDEIKEKVVKIYPYQSTQLDLFTNML